MLRGGYDERYFSNLRGEKFFYRVWRVKGAKAVLVLIHALGLHTGRYAWLCDELSMQGLTCYAVDLYGHGLSDGARGRGALADLLDVANKFLQLVSAKEKATNIFVMGHGVGALIALMAINHVENIKGILAFSPLAEVVDFTSIPLRLRVSSILGLKVQIPLIPPRDVEHADAILEAKADDLVNRKVSARLLLSILEKLRKLEGIEAENIPVLYEEGDRFVKGLEAFSRLVANLGERVSYDPEKERIPFERILEWIHS
ncbi:MAG: hypothetical protein DRJ57_00635 [Thermoprotei archaeon]|nr:MAG: hypothetical protein DRJ57_00635 [Thermoprotei archaeon]